MRIVYLHQYFNTPTMSGITRSYELARRLVAAGHEVHVVTTDRVINPSLSPEWRESIEAGIHVHWTAVPYDNKMGTMARILAFFRFALRAGPRARAIGCDVVFATSTPLTIAIPGVWAARRLRVPMVFEVRDVWPDIPIAIGVLRDPFSKAAARWLERFAYRNAERVVVLAPTMAEVVTRTGYPSERVHVIPNGCDLELFASRKEQAALIRGLHPWLGDRPLAFYGGTFGYLNGVDWLARLAGEVMKLDPEVRFAVAGAGAKEQDIRVAARQAGVLDRTFFLLGNLRKDEVPAWLSAADVAFSLFLDIEPLTRHAVTNKFFDTIASGTAALSNHGGFQAAAAAAAGAGFVLDRYDLPASARKLVAFIRDQGAVSAAGAAARRLAETQFDRDAQAAALERVLNAAVIEKRHGRR